MEYVKVDDLVRVVILWRLNLRRKKAEMWMRMLCCGVDEGCLGGCEKGK